MRNDIYYLSDKTTVHVYEGMKNVGIYDKETGVPKFVDPAWIVMNLDEEWARNRNREIEIGVDHLRAQIEFLDYSYSDIDQEHIEVLEGRIKKLLKERDDITYKFGLAGRAFNDRYEATSGADRDGDVVEDALYDKLIGSGIPMSVIAKEPELTGDSRFRFITEEMVTLYSKKNADYGDAFTESLDEDGLLVSKIRIKDKLKRFSQLIDNDALVNDESMRDTLIDLANYSVMTMMWLDANE